MDKVYYLLRNNRKTGPFTIGEILQQGLRPADLIWVEGKSEKWTRVSEMELMPFADHLPQQAPVITLSQEAFQQVAQHDPHPRPDTEEEPIEFIDHRKEKHQAVRELLAAAMVTVFVAAGVVGGRTLFLGKRGFGTPPTAEVATKLESNKEYTARQAEPERVVADTTAVVVPDSLALAAAVPAAQKTQRPAASNDSVAQVPDTTAGETTPAPPPVRQEVEKPAPVKEAPARPVAEPQRKDSTNNEVKKEDEGEKKKGFLRGLFKKKKKDE